LVFILQYIDYRFIIDVKSLDVLAIARCRSSIYTDGEVKYPHLKNETVGLLGLEVSLQQEFLNSRAIRPSCHATNASTVRLDFLFTGFENLRSSLTSNR
jgi:hypothetical protein